VLALLNQPRLVILDELTQGRDPTARRDVWAAIGQLRDAGTTVLLVTHEMDEAEALHDRVVAMRAGRVLDARAAQPADRPPRRLGHGSLVDATRVHSGRGAVAPPAVIGAAAR
jgi:ABC-2 type transport system ATP-binding protein